MLLAGLVAFSLHASAQTLAELEKARSENEAAAKVAFPELLDPASPLKKEFDRVIAAYKAQGNPILRQVDTPMLMAREAFANLQRAVVAPAPIARVIPPPILEPYGRVDSDDPILNVRGPLADRARASLKYPPRPYESPDEYASRFRILQTQDWLEAQGKLTAEQRLQFTEQLAAVAKQSAERQEKGRDRLAAQQQADALNQELRNLRDAIESRRR